MKKPLALLAMIALLPNYTLEGYTQEEVIQPLNVAVVMESFTCNFDVTSELVAFSEIIYIYLYQYYTPNLPQLYCFPDESKWRDMAYDFILEYNDYVIIMFEDELWYELAPLYGFEELDTVEEARSTEGLADMETAVIFVHFYNLERNPNPYVDNHDWNSLTLTHELSHLILFDYGYNEDVYVDWVHEKDVFYSEYETGYEIFSPLTNNWYEVFERYPVEEDF